MRARNSVRNSFRAQYTPDSREAIRGWIAERGTLEARTATSITSPDALAQEMARIRADGFARDMEESEQGVRCLAAPLRSCL